MSTRRLELEQDLRFQRRSWAFERVGWTLMLLAAAASPLGLLGPGPLSKAEASTPDGALTARYHRLERHDSPVRLRVRFGPPGTADGRIRLRVGRRYLQSMRLERVDPEPESVETGPDHFTFVFKPADPAGDSNAVFHLNAEDRGPVEARLAVEGGGELRLKQFLFP